METILGNIKNNTISFKKNINPLIKDLILKILVRDPL